MKTLQTLDRLLSTPAAQKLIQADLEAKMMEDPGEFFLKFVAPFLPKEAILTLDRRGEEVEKATVRVIHEVVERGCESAASNIAAASVDGKLSSTEMEAVEERVAGTGVVTQPLALPAPTNGDRNDDDGDGSDFVEGEVVERPPPRTVPTRRT